MSKVDPHQQRLHDEYSVVEKEIEAHSGQIDVLKQRLEGLKRAIELFGSDQAAISELLRATGQSSNGHSVHVVVTPANGARKGLVRRGRPPAVRMPSSPVGRSRGRRASVKTDGKVKRVDMIATVLKRRPAMTVRELIEAVGKEYGWVCTESNITGHLYTNPKRFAHTKPDRANKKPITWSLR
jgi:hypothetical protein